MAEYKIIRVSQQAPREWAPADNPERKIYYIKVQLEGHSKPVEIGKKSPDALKAGDTVYGTIQETDYPNDRFKNEQNPNKGFGRNFQPRDDSAIRAQWAIGQSMSFFTAHHKEYDASLVEDLAKTLYAMVDRVKGSSESSSPKAEPAKKDQVRLKKGDPVWPSDLEDDQAALERGLAAQGINVDDF